jgi:hypothetical protein
MMTMHSYMPSEPPRSMTMPMTPEMTRRMQMVASSARYQLSVTASSTTNAAPTAMPHV